MVRNIKKPRRTLVISNICGGLRALQQCLIFSKYDQAKDRLIFLGDYVGNLPDNPNTIEALLWLKRTAMFTPVFIKGDNDRWCGDWLKSGRASRYWLMNEGVTTVKQYIRSKFLISDDHVEFFKHLHDYYIDENNRLFLHAGFESKGGVTDVKYTSGCYFNQSLWKSSLANTKEFEISKRGIPERFRSYLYKEVFITHVPTIDSEYGRYTPETKLYSGEIGMPIDKPMQRRNIYNINTGANNGYAMTIMDVDTKEFWQSYPTRQIYKNKAA